MSGICWNAFFFALRTPPLCQMAQGGSFRKAICSAKGAAWIARFASRPKAAGNRVVTTTAAQSETHHPWTEWPGPIDGEHSWRVCGWKPGPGRRLTTPVGCPPTGWKLGGGGERLADPTLQGSRDWNWAKTGGRTREPGTNIWDYKKCHQMPPEPTNYAKKNPCV